MIKILAFSGSTRKESFNQGLLDIAVAGARESGAEVTEINLNDFPMPIYNQDLEFSEGIPQAAAELKQLMLDHKGLLIASPEYNGFPSTLLKNCLDWVSRPQASHEPPLFAFRGKIAAVMAASPGHGGGVQGLVSLRILLQNLGVMVLPNQVALAKAGGAFREDGRLSNNDLQQITEGLGGDLADVLNKMIVRFE